MLFQVNEIEFDFTDSQGTISEDEQRRFVDATVGQIWKADDEDDLVKKITNATGWCITAIDPHPVLADF